MKASTPSSRAVAVTGEKLDRLKALLREMFQLDRGDLDFGLYRIMKLKAEEIGKFLDDALLPQVKSTLEGISESDRAGLEQDRSKAFGEARKHRPTHPEHSPEVVKLDKRLAAAKADADDEADVYNHLALFFSRYYDEGDFLSLRRYSGGGESEYLIPYGGEEVKLHWANADQYYIKTTENYAAYAFIVNGRRVRFEIAAADNEKDNIKETNGNQRRFVLADGKDAVAASGDQLTIRFDHRPLKSEEKKKWPGNGRTQQNRINEASEKRILKALEPEWQTLLAALATTDTNEKRTLLAKHLDRYTAKNDFDYFIHKDLEGFLTRELDLYLKAKMLNLDDLAAGDSDRLDRALRRMRAAKVIAEKIIAFLAQLENFQKTLWLKKKFVLDTQYCVTLDKVPESLYAEIAKNKAQIDEWVTLFAIDELKSDLATTAYCKPLKPAFLKENPYLVVDTRHFDRDFADRLLAALSDAGSLDEQMDGLLVHGENFQALSLLQARYRGQVKCVYIDPPYNTDSSAILYKNDYKDSSWLSLMEDRLELAKAILSKDGVLCCAIDDEEASLLRSLLQTWFERELGIVPVRTNPAGRKSSGRFSPTHEYAFFYGAEEAMLGSLQKTKKEIERYPFTDTIGRYAWNNLIRHGSGDKREDVPTMFYPIYVGNNDGLRVPQMEWDESRREYKILEKPKSDEIAVWPVKDGVEKRYHRGHERVQLEPNEYRVRRNGEGVSIDFKIRMDEESMPKTWWDSNDYASANHGARVVKELFGEKTFDFAKSAKLVEDCLRASSSANDVAILDYFSGSGTTGHAVINLNREDRGKRKYILVEIGYHFDEVILPRMKKVVYSENWKDGKPVTRRGSTQFFKYIRLESYEDTLDGLTLTPPNAAQQDMLDKNPELAEDYRLRYALGEESAASACLLGMDFADPFAYTLSVVRDGERKEESADLPETFNFLLGLRLESRRRLDGILAITGTDAEGRHCLILWRNLNETDNAALDKWFPKHRGKFPKSLNLIYANGDHTLNALKQKGDAWTAQTIEPVFRELMFEVASNA